MRLAIFDIDGTLVGGSSERSFWRYLWRHKQLSARRLAAFAFFFVRYLPVAGRDVAKKNKAYLTGLELAEIERLAGDFAASELWPRLREPVVARLREHQHRGDIVLLLSGTLQPIASALAARLDVEHVCATLCSASDDRAVARPPARHPYAAAKSLLARAFAREHGLDLDVASAYCDSFRDLDLLEHVGHPVAVMPDRRLREIASRRNWEILGTDASRHSAAARSLRVL
jgi:HAD superfamily hydrolase (TIGR01490 family)